MRTHDPALVAGAEGEPWYVFSTGDRAVADGAVQVRTSSDGRRWTEIDPVWDERPAWVEDVVPDVENFWAPEVYEHDGTFYLYYSASTFGSNRSAIGLATATTLDPADPDHGWTDRGEVLRSEPGRDDWNAIDAGIVEDADGVPWMAFGSFWGGIQMVRLEWPSGLVADPDEPPVTIASRGAPPNAIEAPYVVERDGWYYLFVSKDSCCQGAASTYNIQVGRSRDVTGPYVDAEGRSMLEDGGTPVLATQGASVGPGGQSVSRGHLAYHVYDADAGGDFRLAIRRLAWDDDGWPVATTEPVEG
ncbi:arabinan endo-1,5-alpha-L-arabinosidase [Cellulomonas sp. ATA003]|uniref:arabinan endo-1,5-alpha-L-arabinosidase n=1 Tax=Cellulomonas sp. ATA003 TaxID=3073064 RepID=UPI00287389DF|nr:arabinan endo-1,5-alpha-L-arabinosidase [Cellulomonas sp. ATA003]WNB84548.1 arabinan endo-1,5-alpha-L-arabinosidase [Cellulomonas sp. ATA003]